MTRVGAGLGIDYFKIVTALDDNGNERVDDNGNPVKVMTAESLKANDLFLMLEREGWTKKQFDERVHDFKRSNRWTNWTPADFIADSEPVSLHPYSWLLEMINEDRDAGKRIACYVAPDGSRGYGWTRDFDGVLERYEPEHVAAAPTPVPEEETKAVDPAVDREIALRRRIVELELQLSLARSSILGRRMEQAEERVEELLELVAHLRRDQHTVCGILHDVLDEKISPSEARARFNELLGVEEEEPEMDELEMEEAA